MRLTFVILLTLVACGSTPKRMSTDGKHYMAKTTNDQAELARLARDWSDKVRLAAVQRLTDQKVLAERVEKDKKSEVRHAAVRRLHDQTALDRIAARHPDKYIRREAIKSMKNESALVRIATTHMERPMRATAAATLTSQAGLAQVLDSKASLAVEVAHVGLLVHAPAFQRRFPGASLDVSVTATSQRYSGHAGIRTMTGDRGSIQVVQEGKRLGRATWSTPFPKKTTLSGAGPGYVTVPVAPLIRTLVTKLTAADCREFAGSPSDIVRSVTTIRAANPDALAALAVNDPDAATRAAAVARSTDQALKARVARTDQSDAVRFAAVRTLTDKETLTEIVNDPEETKAIRDAAKARLK